jgi:DNA-binding CsgD family transcriptional regulator
MAPSLSSADVRALHSVHDALLDPLSHETTEAWLLDVCTRFQRLCHASASMVGFSPEGQAPQFISPDMPQRSLDRMLELTPGPGSLRTNDPNVEYVMEGFRRRVSGVATTADLLGPGGLKVDDLRESPVFREVAFPLGVPGSTMLLHTGASGEFILHASYPEIDRRAFGDDTQQVLGSLLPAFAASVGAVVRLGNARQAIAALLDALEDGAVVFTTDARRVLARNSAMTVLAQRESDRAGLEQALIRSAVAAVHCQRHPSDPQIQNASALSTGWRSSSGTSYRLRTVRLPAGSVARDEAILVLAQRVGPAVPDPLELVRRFGLTRREAEVAIRLAYGRSDREIAGELQLSPHTVRHHAEAVFVKLDVTSRKALALHLGSPG